MDVGSIKNNNNLRIDHPQMKIPSLYKEKAHEEPKAKTKEHVSDKKDTVDKNAMVEKMEQMLQDSDLNNVMKIKYDPDLDRIVVQVLDGDSYVVKKQVPSQDFIEFMKRFKEALGALVERSV